MNARLPEPFRPGDPVTGLRAPLNELRALVEHLLKNHIKSGPGIYITAQSGHLIISTQPRPQLPQPRSTATTTRPSPGSLVIIQTSTNKIRVTWGTVENTIPENITTDATLTDSRQVWIEAVMQTTAPYRVISAAIKAESGGVPEPDPPDPDTGEPPEKLYFLLGEVTVSDGQITDIQNTNGLVGGSIGVYLQSAGTTCRPADPGDPEADPPIPPKEGGIVDMLQWVTYRK